MAHCSRVDAAVAVIRSRVYEHWKAFGIAKEITAPQIDLEESRGLRREDAL